MERDYGYEGFNIHVEIESFTSISPHSFRVPDVRFTAIVTISRAGTRTLPVLPRMRLSDRNGQRFSSAAETLLAASTAGQRAIDDLVRSRAV